MQLIDGFRQRAPIRFSLGAVNLDSGYEADEHDVIAKTCEARGWEYRIEHTAIGEVFDDILDPGATRCSFRSRRIRPSRDSCPRS